MEVVINACYGGFSVSLEAAEHMAENGCAVAKAEVDKYEAKRDGKAKLTRMERASGVEWYGYLEVPRNSPQLVAAVKDLGKAASGSMSELKIVEIPDDVEWQIEEYDGVEWVAEKHRKWE